MKWNKRLALLSLPFLLVSCKIGENSATGNETERKTDMVETDSSLTEKGEPATEPDTSPSITYETEELAVKNGEGRIVGDFYRPKVEGKTPLVLLSHSAFLTGKSLRVYAKFFASHGYAAYAFDFCGGSNNSRSDGKVADMTIFTEAGDLKTVFSYFTSLNTIDCEKVYLLGSSQGGLVTSVVAKELGDKVAGLFLFYPAFNIPEQVKNSFFSGPYGEEFIDTLRDYDPYEGMEKFTKPVLIFHGTKDSTVPISYSEKAVNCYPNAELIRIEGASHGFNTDNYSFTGNYDSQVFSALMERI